MVWWLIGAAVVVVLLARSRWWPKGPCPACRRRGGRGIGSTDRAFNRCRWCGGSRERIRPLALIWPQHRQAASKRKTERSKR